MSSQQTETDMTKTTPDYIKALPIETLKAIEASTSPNGKYRRELEWAQREIARRAVEAGAA
jgi:hypothetical protein